MLLADRTDLNKGDTTSVKTVAIFGATGYVGLMLVNRLVLEDVSLRLFVRNRRRLNYLKRYGNLSICDTEIDLDSEELIESQLRSIDVVYYLIHSMSNAADSFEQVDIKLAHIVSRAAKNAGVRQIIYLGGLGQEEEDYPLSTHLRSRIETGEALRSGGVPVTEVRAGVIIGAGSVSFEIIRALSSRLPFVPKLVFNKGRCQPIDIDDVIDYLFHVHLHPSYIGQIIEIGMDDILAYDEMIQLFAKYSGRRHVPSLWFPYIDGLLSKKVVARAIAFLSAIPYELTLPLVEGMESQSLKGKYAYENYHTSCQSTVDVAHREALIERDLNVLTPLSFKESVQKAFLREAEGRVESFWSIPLKLQVLSREKEKFLYLDHDEKEGLLFEEREREVDAADVSKVFKEVLKIGGEHGYWSPQWMWSYRAKMDKFMGGPGLNVGRRTFDKVPRIGERLDFWIVSDYLDEPTKKVLTLKGRLKSPGDSWLQFALIRDDESKKWRFLLRAYFRPSGIAGYLYWYSLFFIHKYIFTAMINKIIGNAQQEEG